jgi:putative phosphoribosyl transferase
MRFRKVGVPSHPELGVGAVAEGGYTHLQCGMPAALGLSEDDLSEVVERERREVQRSVKLFRGAAPPPDLAERTVLLVDDGIATGDTVRAALQAIRAERPKRLVLAVPVASPDALDELAQEADQIACLLAPSSLHAIGLWYRDSRQVSNEQVLRLLAQRREELVQRSTRTAKAGVA